MRRWTRRTRVRPRHRPRILSERAVHSFTYGGDADPGNPLSFEVFMDCARCGQHRRALRQDFAAGKYANATGCAGHRFRGRYRPGDQVDVDNMRYVFMRPVGATALVHEIYGRRRVFQFPVELLEPVLAGRDEAEQRRLRYLERVGGGGD